jgi:hypothetical protein
MLNSQHLKKAEEGKYLYQIGKISQAEAKEMVMPYINEFNEKAKGIAKKYGRKPQVISFTKFCR